MFRLPISGQKACSIVSLSKNQRMSHCAYSVVILWVMGPQHCLTQDLFFKQPTTDICHSNVNLIKTKQKRKKRFLCSPSINRTYGDHVWLRRILLPANRSYFGVVRISNSERQAPRSNISHLNKAHLCGSFQRTAHTIKVAQTNNLQQLFPKCGSCPTVGLMDL